VHKQLAYSLEYERRRDCRVGTWREKKYKNSAIGLSRKNMSVFLSQYFIPSVRV